MGVPSSPRVQKLFRAHRFLQEYCSEAEKHFIRGAEYYEEYRRKAYYRPITDELIVGRVRELAAPPVKGQTRGRTKLLQNPHSKGRAGTGDAVRLFLSRVHIAWLIGTNRTPVSGKRPCVKHRRLFTSFASDAMDLLAIGDQTKRIGDFWRWRAEQQKDL